MRLLFCLLTAACTAAATQIPGLTFEQMVHESEQIVTGHVIRSWTAWSPSHEFIWTHYEVQIESVAKGHGAASITVSEPGGVLDGRAMDIGGAVHYETGEHVMLFVSKTPIGYYRTVGWSQGKYKIGADGNVHGTSSDVEIVPTMNSGARKTMASIDGKSIAAARASIAVLVAKEAVTR